MAPAYIITLFSSLEKKEKQSIRTSSKILYTSVYWLNFQMGKKNKNKNLKEKEKENEKKINDKINLGRHYDLITWF